MHQKIITRFANGNDVRLFYVPIHLWEEKADLFRNILLDKQDVLII